EVEEFVNGIFHHSYMVSNLTATVKSKAALAGGHAAAAPAPSGAHPCAPRRPGAPDPLRHDVGGTGVRSAGPHGPPARMPRSTPSPDGPSAGGRSRRQLCGGGGAARCSLRSPFGTPSRAGAGPAPGGNVAALAPS